MALRPAWSTCPSARFRLDGSWERQSRDWFRPQRAGAGHRWLRNGGTRQRPTAAATDQGQRHDHAHGDRRTTATDRDRTGTDSADPQNQHVRQPPIRSKAPVDVVFVAANLTDFDSRLEVHGPKQDAQSELLVANGNISLLTSLPTGVYTVSAADIPAAKPARLMVGPYRTSSQNNV